MGGFRGRTALKDIIGNLCVLSSSHPWERDLERGQKRDMQPRTAIVRTGNPINLWLTIQLLLQVEKSLIAIAERTNNPCFF